MKLFAIIEPIYNFPSSVYTATFELGMNFFRSYRDEKVTNKNMGSFSLNKHIEFFYTLDAAKFYIEASVKIMLTFPVRSAIRDSEKAIIELEVENGKIQKFSNIYKMDYDHAFLGEKYYQWSKSIIQPSDLTANALHQINQQYQKAQLAIAQNDEDNVVDDSQVDNVNTRRLSF